VAHAVNAPNMRYLNPQDGPPQMISQAVALMRAVRQRLEMRRYDDFTIAEYFRRQGASVGDDCRILVRTLGSEPYLVTIGRHVTISGDVTLVTHDGAAWVFTDEVPSAQRFGPIAILDNCFIGARSVILPGVRIGPSSVVGAGAVVTNDVPPETVVAGCPARKVCDLAEYRQKTLAAWARQRPPKYMSDLVEGKHYSAVRIQAAKTADAQLLRDHLTALFGLGTRGS
jgi:acetyltransferase-like isoleucine patch superfamily enzyme